MITVVIVLAYGIGAVCGVGALAYAILVFSFWAADRIES